MKGLISERWAANLLLLIFALVTAFHLLILLGMVPYDVVWGGRLSNTDQMVVFESISLLLNVIMFVVVGLHTGLFKIRLDQRITVVALWLMTILFLINTVGNLLSSNQWEKIIFTPLTLIICVLCFRLALGKKSKTSSIQNER